MMASHNTTRMHRNDFHASVLEQKQRHMPPQVMCVRVGHDKLACHDARRLPARVPACRDVPSHAQRTSAHFLGPHLGLQPLFKLGQSCWSRAACLGLSARTGAHWGPWKVRGRLYSTHIHRIAADSMHALYCWDFGPAAHNRTMQMLWVAPAQPQCAPCAAAAPALADLVRPAEQQ